MDLAFDDSFILIAIAAAVVILLLGNRRNVVVQNTNEETLQTPCDVCQKVEPEYIYRRNRKFGNGRVVSYNV